MPMSRSGRHKLREKMNKRELLNYNRLLILNADLIIEIWFHGFGNGMKELLTVLRLSIPATFNKNRLFNACECFVIFYKCMYKNVSSMKVSSWEVLLLVSHT